MDYLHWIFLALYVTLAAAAIVAILLDNRQPAKTMAWVLVLVFLPVVGIVLYFFFGQNVRKERAISQQRLDQLTKRTMLEFTEQTDLEVPPDAQRLVELFARQGLALPFQRNEAELFLNGYEFFPQLLRDIAAARDHIHLDFFIFDDDSLGNLIADALIAKAAEGVEVRVICDDVGCWSVSSRFFERMREGGVEVHLFMPVRFPAFTSKANYRNHRKIAVFDGRIGYAGGMNIARRYVQGTPRQAWRDTMVRVRGNVVYGLQRAFLVDWFFVDRTLITNRRYYPEFPLPDTLCLAQVVTSNPIDPWPLIEQGYVRILHSARQYVYIETPYFLPTDPVLFALRTAALSGVDVRLMIPLRGDSRFVTWASRSFVREIKDAGVKVLFYEAGFNHSKILVSDDRLATIGSTNVDFRSFEHDFESNLFFYDRTMALRVKQVFLDDEANSVALDQLPCAHAEGVLQRLWESMVRLLSPLM